MPKKSKITFTLNWKDDAYKGFATDIKSLLDLCVGINRDGAIAKTKDELQGLSDNMPEGDAKTALNGVISQIKEIQDFIEDFVKSQSQKNSSLNSMLAGNYNEEYGESMYRGDILHLKTYLKLQKPHFFASEYNSDLKRRESEKGALPLDLRAAFDRFNELDDYNSFDKNEALFKRVDDMFNQFVQVQNLMARIDTLQENFRTEHRLKDHITVKETEMKEVGKIAYENKDLVFSAVESELNVQKSAQKDSETLRKSADKDYQKKITELNNEKFKKNDLEKRKDEYKKNQEKAQNTLKEIEQKRQTVTKNKALMEEVGKMKLSTLEGFEKALMQDTLSAAEILNMSYGEHIKQQRSYQHHYSDQVQKSAAEAKKLSEKNKGLKGVYDTAISARRYKMYPPLIKNIFEGVRKLPSSLGISMENMTIQKLVTVLKRLIEKDERVAPLYEAASVAADICPPELRVRDIDAQLINDAALLGAQRQQDISKDTSYAVASNVYSLMVEGQACKDRIAQINREEEEAKESSKEKDPKKARKKDPEKERKAQEARLKEKKELETRLKAIPKEITILKKQKGYVKDSENLLKHMRDCEENMEKANACRFNVADTFAAADQKEIDIKESKQKDITREKYTVIADMEIILQKVPAEPADMVEKMKKAVADIKGSDNIADVRKAYKSFKDNLETLDKEVKGSIYDLNKAEEAAKKDAATWDYDAAMKACDEKISSLGKAVDDAEKNYDKHLKITREYSSKVEKLTAINTKLNQLYDDRMNIQRFESEKENGSEAKSDLLGKPLFVQLQKTFVAFSRRKDHNKGDHQNTEEYGAMETMLNKVLELDPGKVTAASYRQALSDLQAASLAYIEKKNAQSFHWVPSKLRKFRLQFAKGLVDMCKTQLDTIDVSDFTTIDASVSKYLDDVIAHPVEAEEYTKEQYLSNLTDRKQECIELYKKSAGIEEASGVANQPDRMQMNVMPGQMEQIQEPGIVDPQRKEVKKEMLQP